MARVDATLLMAWMQEVDKLEQQNAQVQFRLDELEQDFTAPGQHLTRVITSGFCIWHCTSSPAYKSFELPGSISGQLMHAQASSQGLHCVACIKQH